MRAGLLVLDNLDYRLTLISCSLIDRAGRCCFVVTIGRVCSAWDSVDRVCCPAAVDSAGFAVP